MGQVRHVAGDVGFAQGCEALLARSSDFAQARSTLTGAEAVDRTGVRHNATLARLGDAMPTRFHVDGIAAIRDRRQFVLLGTVSEGTPGVGQVPHVAGLDARVASTDPVFLSSRDGVLQGRAALAFEYTNEAQLDGWSALQLIGTTIELVGRDDLQCRFRAGDEVVYSPTERGHFQDAMTEFAALVPGQAYRIARVERSAYLVMEGFERIPGGGLHWTEFKAPP